MYFSDNGPYFLNSSNSWYNDLQCNNSNKWLNVNTDHSNLKVKSLYELRMKVLNKRLEQLMFNSRYPGK